MMDPVNKSSPLVQGQSPFSISAFGDIVPNPFAGYLVYLGFGHSTCLFLSKWGICATRMEYRYIQEPQYEFREFELSNGVVLYAGRQLMPVARHILRADNQCMEASGAASHPGDVRRSVEYLYRSWQRTRIRFSFVSSYCIRPVSDHDNYKVRFLAPMVSRRILIPLIHLSMTDIGKYAK